jgi:hypothetical protein
MLDKSRVSALMGVAFAACLVDLAGHGGYSGRGGVWIGWQGRAFGGVGGGLCCYDDWVGVSNFCL